MYLCIEIYQYYAVLFNVLSTCRPAHTIAHNFTNLTSLRKVLSQLSNNLLLAIYIYEYNVLSSIKLHKHKHDHSLGLLF